VAGNGLCVDGRLCVRRAKSLRKMQAVRSAEYAERSALCAVFEITSRRCRLCNRPLIHASTLSGLRGLLYVRMCEITSKGMQAVRSAADPCDEKYAWGRRLSSKNIAASVWDRYVVAAHVRGLLRHSEGCGEYRPASFILRSLYPVQGHPCLMAISWCRSRLERCSHPPPTPHLR
jgi:hypothetical protein